MSKYAEKQTEFKDGTLLVEALKALGFDTVEVHDKAQRLEGYQGDLRANTANIIVRRKYVGSASNDLGFKQNADGTYTAIISDYDSSRYNRQWLTNLKTEYAKAGVMRQAARAGLRFTRQTGENGKIQLKFLKA